MSEVITIYQDYKQNINKHREHFSTIEEFKDVFGEQNLILQTDGSIQIKNFVGFFQKGNTKVQVLPKIYRNTGIQPSEMEESMAFLFRLLEWSGYLTFKDFDQLDISSNQKNVLEIFIRIFIQRFLAEFNRAPHYEYVSVVEDQQIIKGKIRFSDTIKRNSFISHQHVVEFDEFSIDNPLNQLFKYVIQELLILTNDGKNKMLLRQGSMLLEEVNAINVSPELFNNIQFDRQNQRYKSLFNYAKLFFYNNQPGISAGKERTFSFLVQLNILFEKTVLVFLEGIENSMPKVKLQYHNHKYFGSKKGENRFRLEPDFIISDKNTKKTLAILDTKFKCPYNNQNEAIIKDSDLYQLTTYASAYDSQLLFVIYPVFKNAPSNCTEIATYELNTKGRKTRLVLLQVDVTEESREKIEKKLNAPILNALSIYLNDESSTQ